MKTIGLMFPGQGSQYVAMGKELCELYPQAKETFEKTNDILGFDLLKIIMDGPEETLRQTRYTQPAIFSTSIAAYRVFMSNFNASHANWIAAGHSLGEYSALCAAGAFSFEDGLKLVKARGEFIQQASEKNPGTMAAILGLDKAKVAEICSEASSRGVCEPVNFNSPGQIVIAEP